MNEFYEELMCPIIYRWIKGHNGVQACCKSCSLCIENGEEHGTIRFHDDNIVELVIENQTTHETVFYLHFQMHDMKASIEQFETFFSYLKQPHLQHEEVYLEKSSIKNILLSCSGGLTTSYFAYAMQEIVDQKNMNVRIDAVAYTDIDTIEENYDVILLAPQIAYMLPEYKRKYGKKVMSISSIDFATSQFDGILNKAMSHHAIC